MVDILAIILIFGTPILLGTIISIAVLTNNKHIRQQKDKQRESFERIMMEKLDIIKTAVAMGYTHNELAELDSRLEKLIGREKLEGLLTDTGAPNATPEIHSVDLDTEAKRIQAMKKQAE